MGIKSKIKKIRTKMVYFRNTYRVRKSAKKCGERLLCGGSQKSYVSGNTIIGDDVSFNGMTIIGNGEVVIGNHFHCGQQCFIISDNHDYDGGETLPYSNTHSIPKKIVIEDNVWFGVGVIVLGDAHIGEGAIIQAGSVVIGNIPAGAIAGGHPAKVFKYRDMEHYNELKEANKFVLNIVQ